MSGQGNGGQAPLQFQLSAGACDSTQTLPPNGLLIDIRTSEVAALETSSASPVDKAITTSVLAQTIYLNPSGASRIASSLGPAACPILPTTLTEWGASLLAVPPSIIKAAPIKTSQLGTTTTPSTSGPAPGPTDSFAPSTVPSNPAKKDTTGKGTNPGAIAGGVVGGLVLGILIGAAILFLLGFRRRKSRTTAHEPANAAISRAAAPGPPNAAYGYSEDKLGIASSTTMSIPMESAAAIVERNLPDPIADNDIDSEFSKVDDKINGHVNSFYSQSHANDHLATAQAIAPLLGAGSSVTLQKINALLANPQTRSTALRFALAKIITSRMDLDGASPHALLPFGTAATLRGIPKVQTNDPTRLAFMTKWRAITAYLMGIPSNTNTVSEESIRQTVLDCEAIVGPYATPTMEQQTRLQNLEGICRRAGRVSGMLFSQQALYKFDWSQSGPGLVVFPGLVKITNETGGVLQTPMVFAEKKMVQV